jgi:ABC-type transporter Mla MlaB component
MTVMNAQAVNMTLQNNCLLIEGDLTFNTIMQARVAFATGLVGQDLPDCLDLSGVSVCDSTAVAWVLELQSRGLKVLCGVPAGFLAIIRVCQLDALFPNLAHDRAQNCHA